MQKHDLYFFDETGYESEGEDEPDIRTIHRKARQSQKDPKALTPTQSNMTLSMRQGQELIELMKNRGFEMNQAQIKRMKSKQPQVAKSSVSRGKAGFYDGGHSATVQELLKALNKAYSQNDTQQASCILSCILQKKELEKKDRSKFSLMKCNLLFNHGNYEQCCNKATQFIQQQIHSQLSTAILSTYLARCKAELNRVWEGHIDLERAKSLLIDFKIQKQKELDLDNKNLDSQFVDTELDAVIRDFNTTQLEYNIRINKQKYVVNTLQPFYPQFKNSRIQQVSCGDNHALVLVSGSYDQDLRKIQTRNKWKTQVFGFGENSAGQVMGKLYDKNLCNQQPVLIKQLSGKGIVGIFANKQSSLAYDQSGNVYQWGVKSSGKKQIQKVFSIGMPIKKLEKGNQHYAILVESNKLFILGTFYLKQTKIITHQQLLQVKHIVDVLDFSCGSNNIVVVNKQNQLFGVGSNENGQLPFNQKFIKQFIKSDTTKIGKIEKIFCIGDCTFVLTQDQQLFYRGKYSYKKQPTNSWKIAEFTDEISYIISVSGHTGVYYVTNQNGQIYKWNVDNSVKFRKHIQNQKSTPRMIQCSRGIEYRLKTLPQPELCSAKLITKSLKTYTPIIIQIQLFDKLGIYGLLLPQSLKINLCLSKKEVGTQDLIVSSQKFIKLTGNKYTKNQVYLDEIIQNSLLSYSITPSAISSKVLIEVMIEKAGSYYLYLMMNALPIKGSPLKLDVQQSEKQAELEKKMIEQRERKKKLLQQKRLKEQQARKQEEDEKLRQQERRKETQKRADEALKKHMRQQQQQRQRVQSQRKRKAQLQTGGGFDLSKVKRKSSTQQVKEQQYKGTVPQLPNINTRPSSKRKLVLKKTDTPTSVISTSSTIKSTILKRGDSKTRKPL